jgi:hypothetical protein
MRLPMLWHFSATFIRLFDTHMRGRTARSIAPAGEDRQTALDYELSFRRAAAQIWF